MNSIAVTAVFFLLSQLSASQTLSRNVCSQTDVERAAAQVHSVRQRLLELPVGDGLQTDVSPAARETIASMRDALADFISTYLQCVPPQPDVAKINSDLAALGRAFEMPAGPIAKENVSPDSGKFGFELSFHAKVFDNPRLLGVVADFSIECGGDTVLLLFAPSSKSWRQVPRWQKKPYAAVDGGTIGFDYGVAPSDDEGHWFLVTHDIAPWCSSTWSGIRYSVLRPTADPLHPRVLFSADDAIWWGDEDFGTLTVQKEGFDLRFHAASIDGGVHNRVWVRHFSVSGDTVRRTQPVAVSPRDFVDEWIISPWREAAQWSSSSALAELKQSHATWARGNKSDHKLLEYYSVQRCSDAPDRYQIEIGEESGPNFETTRSFYFQVAGDDVYTMLRVSEKSDRRCRGPNILEEMSTK